MSQKYLPFIESRTHTRPVSNGWDIGVSNTGAGSASQPAEQVSGWDSQTYSVERAPAGESLEGEYAYANVTIQGTYAAVDESTAA